jgi:hypothetical protein
VNTGQPGGGQFDERTWLSGIASAAISAVLSGVVLLAVQDGQWIWVISLVLVAIVTALYLSLRRTAVKRGAILGFLAAGVALGLVLTFGFTQLSANPKGKQSIAGPARSNFKIVQSATTDPQKSDDGMKIAFDAPAPMASIPLGGTVATGSAEGTLGEGWKLWLAKFSANNGRFYVVGQISIVNGRWSAQTGQIGSEDPRELGNMFILKVIRANPVASKMLEPNEATADDGIPALPAGAQVVAERSIIRG